MKRTYLNLGLLVVVAALGFAVWFSQKKEEKGPPLTALKQDAITQISVQHPNKPAIRLEKKEAKWMLIEPVRAPADPFEVNGILGLTELEVKSKLDAANVALAELGLEPPAYTVSLNDQTIAIGGTEPIKYRRYARVGNMIGLVDDPPSAALDSDFSDLIAREVLPAGAELKKIELPGLTLEKDTEGKWTSPQKQEATAQQLTQLAEGWRTARAMWNAAEPEAKPKGDSVKLTLTDGSVIELVVIERDPQLVLSRPEWKVRHTLSKALATELFEVPVPKQAETGEGAEATPQDPSTEPGSASGNPLTP